MERLKGLMRTALTLGLYSRVWRWRSSCHCLKIPNVNRYHKGCKTVVVLLLLNPTTLLRNYLSWKILKLILYLTANNKNPAEYGLNWWEFFSQVRRHPRNRHPKPPLAPCPAVLQTQLLYLQVGILVTFHTEEGRRIRGQKAEWACQSHLFLLKIFPRTCVQWLPLTSQWPELGHLAIPTCEEVLKRWSS